MAVYTYDEEADALYILLVDDEEAAIARTIELSDTLHVDVNENGTPVGIEILHPQGGDADLQPVRDRFGVNVRLPFRFVA